MTTVNTIFRLLSRLLWFSCIYLFRSAKIQLSNIVKIKVMKFISKYGALWKKVKQLTGLNIIFSKVGVPLLVENNESLVITMNGSGYDPYVMGDTVKMTDIEEIEMLPRKQLVIAPNQVIIKLNFCDNSFFFRI